jgi:hypothetical protein
MERMDYSFPQNEKRDNPYIDPNGSPRSFREMPDGTVVPLSTQEFAEEMDRWDTTVPDRWPKEKKTPKHMTGKRDLGSFVQSGTYKEPKPKFRSPLV